MQRETTSGTTTPAMTMLVLLTDENLSAASKFPSLLQTAFPAATFFNEGAMAPDQPPYLFKTKDFLCNIMHVGAPAPLSSSDQEIKNALLWPNAWEDIRRHQSHIILSLAGGDDPNARAIVLQRMIAAVLETEIGIIGTVFPFSGALLPKKAVDALIAEPEHVRVPFFLSCFFAEEFASSPSNSAILVSTKGMSEFGLMEIEARHFTGSVQELHQFIFAFADHLIDVRPDIRDGHSIGLSENNNFVVKIERSLFYPDDVYCLHFEHRV